MFVGAFLFVDCTVVIGAFVGAVVVDTGVVVCDKVDDPVDVATEVTASTVVICVALDVRVVVVDAPAETDVVSVEAGAVVAAIDADACGQPTSPN